MSEIKRRLCKLITGIAFAMFVLWNVATGQFVGTFQPKRMTPGARAVIRARWERGARYRGTSIVYPGDHAHQVLVAQANGHPVPTGPKEAPRKPAKSGHLPDPEARCTCQRCGYVSRPFEAMEIRGQSLCLWCYLSSDVKA